MIPAISPQQLQHACAALSSADLICLVSEIDDHEAIPPRALTRTLTALTTHQIRQAVDQADTLGLLDRSLSGLELTAAGRDLADLYDATARWARRNNYPAATGDFAGRIHHTFALLAETIADARFARFEVDAELRRIRRQMADWLSAHQPQQTSCTSGVAA
ncbi:hypothetical protein ACWC24_14160 [Streptomyces sp. NPDC001443]